MKGGGLTSQLVKGSVTPLSFAAVTQTVIFGKEQRIYREELLKLEPRSEHILLFFPLEDEVT